MSESDRKSVDPFPAPPIPEIDSEGLMVPPWVKFPNLTRQSMGWRMGMGEDYRERFQSWYNKQLRTTHKRLWVTYPEPDEWRGFYRRQKAGG